VAFDVKDYKLSQTIKPNGCNLVVNGVQSKHIGTYNCQDLSLGDHGHSVELVNGDENLALYKDTAQRSTHNEMRPGNAVDGSLSTYSHTSSWFQEWWSVDLEQVTAVGRVRITNRNVEPQRLRDFIIGLTNERFWNSKPDLDKSSMCKYYVGYPPGGIPTDIYCESNTKPGRFLFILMTIRDYLHVSEVEVYYK